LRASPFTLLLPPTLVLLLVLILGLSLGLGLGLGLSLGFSLGLGLILIVTLYRLLTGGPKIRDIVSLLHGTVRSSALSRALYAPTFDFLAGESKDSELSPYFVAGVWAEPAPPILLGSFRVGRIGAPTIESRSRRTDTVPGKEGSVTSRKKKELGSNNEAYTIR
jgi:hypothetical protein